MPSWFTRTAAARIRLAALPVALLLLGASCACIGALVWTSAAAQTQSFQGTLWSRFVFEQGLQVAICLRGHLDCEFSMLSESEAAPNQLESRHMILAPGYSGRVVARWGNYAFSGIELGFQTTMGEYRSVGERRLLAIGWEREEPFVLPQLTTAEKQWDLYTILFGVEPDNHLRYSINPYDNCPWLFLKSYPDGVDPCVQGWWGYQGGHSGWDAHRVGDGHQFYSLSPGTVKCTTTGTGEQIGLIAVLGDDGVLVTYLHHEGEAAVTVGQFVPLGWRLGTQGTTGRTSTNNHVHVETRRLETSGLDARELEQEYCRTSRGEEQTGGFDPVDYLHRDW